jgi:hypothetical protein
VIQFSVDSLFSGFSDLSLFVLETLMKAPVSAHQTEKLGGLLKYDWRRMRMGT